MSATFIIVITDLEINYTGLQCLRHINKTRIPERKGNFCADSLSLLVLISGV